MQVAAKVPLSQRINLRMLAFIGVLATLVGYPVSVLIEMQLNGGIKTVAGGYKLVDLKAMSSFDFDQINGTPQDIPQKWRDLDGQKVILYGEMWNSSSTGGAVDSVVLCYSVMNCCIQGPPLVQHFVDARAMPGKSLETYPGQVQVKGVLHVDVQREEGRVSNIYRLDVESIEPAA